MEGFLEEVAIEILNVLYGNEASLPKQDIIYPLVYSAFYYDIETIKNQFKYFKNSSSDAYSIYPEQLIILTSILEQFGKTELTEDILKFSIEEYPENYEGFQYIGMYYINNNRNDLARKYLNESIELSDDQQIINEIQDLIDSIE